MVFFYFFILVGLSNKMTLNILIVYNNYKLTINTVIMNI